MCESKNAARRGAAFFAWSDGAGRYGSASRSCRLIGSNLDNSTRLHRLRSLLSIFFVAGGNFPYQRTEGAPYLAFCWRDVGHPRFVDRETSPELFLVKPCRDCGGCRAVSKPAERPHRRP